MKQPCSSKFLSMRRILLMSAACALNGAACCAGETPAWENIDLGGLSEVRSTAGNLSVTLHAAPLDVAFGEATVQAWVYNGHYAGPVLRARPGDFVQIDLDNELPEATNLHFHGLRVTPQGTGDNMHVVVLPHTKQRYRFQIPFSHPPGLFWFHDHVHGLAEKHVSAGLSGTILIDGFAQQIRGMAGMTQKLLVLKDFGEPGCTDPFLKTELHCRAVSVNGTLHWAGLMRTGETQLWRIANEGANYTIHLAAKGLRFSIIGRDGLPAMRAETAETLDVMPASRLDVLATAMVPGEFTLEALHLPTGGGSAFGVNRTLGTITVTEALSRTPPGALALPNQGDLRKVAVTNRRIIVLNESADSLQYLIDGRRFDAGRTDVRVPLGAIEEWTIRNTTQDFHVFHIHQIGFQVLEINGVKQDFDGFVDDVRVPEMGEVKLLMPFTDPVIVGRFMFHCHVLRHEDAGMMANIEVFQPGQILSAPSAAPICHGADDNVPAPAQQTRFVPGAARGPETLLDGLRP